MARWLPFNVGANKANPRRPVRIERALSNRQLAGMLDRLNQRSVAFLAFTAKGRRILSIGKRLIAEAEARGY
jgi:hypothetical protein